MAQQANPQMILRLQSVHGETNTVWHTWGVPTVASGHRRSQAVASA